MSPLEEKHVFEMFLKPPRGLLNDDSKRLPTYHALLVLEITFMEPRGSDRCMIKHLLRYPHILLWGPLG